MILLDNYQAPEGGPRNYSFAELVLPKRTPRASIVAALAGHPIRARAFPDYGALRIVIRGELRRVDAALAALRQLTEAAP